MPNFEQKIFRKFFTCRALLNWKHIASVFCFGIFEWEKARKNCSFDLSQYSYSLFSVTTKWLSFIKISIDKFCNVQTFLLRNESVFSTRWTLYYSKKPKNCNYSWFVSVYPNHNSPQPLIWTFSSRSQNKGLCFWWRTGFVNFFTLPCIAVLIVPECQNIFNSDCIHIQIHFYR